VGAFAEARGTSHMTRHPPGASGSITVANVTMVKCRSERLRDISAIL